jgi:hypothetical protein
MYLKNLPLVVLLFLLLLLLTAYNTKFCPKNSKFLGGKLMTTRSFNPSSAIVHKQNRCANRRTQVLGRKQTRIESGRAASRVRVCGGGNRNLLEL